MLAWKHGVQFIYLNSPAEWTQIQRIRVIKDFNNEQPILNLNKRATTKYARNVTVEGYVPTKGTSIGAYVDTLITNLSNFKTDKI